MSAQEPEELDRLNSEVRQAIEICIGKLRLAGAEIVETGLPSLPLAANYPQCHCPINQSR